jgi:hypothetical protein
MNSACLPTKLNVRRPVTYPGMSTAPPENRERMGESVVAKVPFPMSSQPIPVADNVARTVSVMAFNQSRPSSICGSNPASGDDLVDAVRQIAAMNPIPYPLAAVDRALGQQASAQYGIADLIDRYSAGQRRHDLPGFEKQTRAPCPADTSYGACSGTPPRYSADSRLLKQWPNLGVAHHLNLASADTCSA